VYGVKGAENEKRKREREREGRSKEKIEERKELGK